MNTIMTQSRYAFYIAIFVMSIGLIISGIHPQDRLTWCLEVFPVLIVLFILIFTFKKFPLTYLLYGLITIHAIILLVGGHYTYAEVPLGYWLEHVFNFSRNHFDRLGHLAQGFVPAIALRELLLRTSHIGKSKWLPALIIASCLGISAFYELFEWWVALILHQDADSFLGTQGDPWDTQWDMFMALIGAILSLLLLSRWHDRCLQQLNVH